MICHHFKKVLLGLRFSMDFEGWKTKLWTALWTPLSLIILIVPAITHTEEQFLWFTLVFKLQVQIPPMDEFWKWSRLKLNLPMFLDILVLLLQARSLCFQKSCFFDKLWCLLFGWLKVFFLPLSKFPSDTAWHRRHIQAAKHRNAWELLSKYKSTHTVVLKFLLPRHLCY